MSKVLILSDVHDSINKAQKALDKYVKDCDKIIQLGDIFDSWEGETKEAKASAKWLKEKMTEYSERWIQLYGNHDMDYHFSHNVHLQCPGFTHEKCRIINSILTHEDWDKFKLFHYEDGFYFSHAGIHPYVFTHPVKGLTLEVIQEYCDQAMEAARMKVAHPVTTAGQGRYGRQYRGGITWLDWFSEFKPIDNFNQVVGHSYYERPQMLLGNNSINWNIDCGLSWIGFLENGKFRTEKL